MKNELLEALAQLWEEYPDMRLGQLIDWVAGGNAYYMNDATLLRSIKDKLQCQITFLLYYWIFL